MSLENAHLILLSHLPGATELTLHMGMINNNSNRRYISHLRSNKHACIHTNPYMFTHTCAYITFVRVNTNAQWV